MNIVFLKYKGRNHVTKTTFFPIFQTLKGGRSFMYTGMKVILN